MWLALTGLVAGGAANLILSSSRNAIVQAYVDDAMRGRTQGILTVALVGGPQLANVLHGLIGSALGPRWAIGAGGILCVVGVSVAIWFAPELWGYRSTAVRAPAV